MEHLNAVSGRRPVIGLAGFFGYGNFGDELFVSVYKEYLGGDFDLVYISDMLDSPYYSRPLSEIVDSLDAVVIGGGDIVQPWGMDARYFSKEFLKKPVFIIGVGVPIRAAATANPSHQEKEWIVNKYAAFFQHPSVKMIHARDFQSVNWIKTKLNPLVDVIEAPDIVCALTLPAALPSPRREGSKTLGVITRSRPNQEDDYSIVEAIAKQKVSSDWSIKHIVLGSGRVGFKDLKDTTKLDVDKTVIYNQSLERLCAEIGSCDVLMSMKFHGTVVATMYGVPSVVMIPTNKNRNFMERIGREDLVSKFDSEKLFEIMSDQPKKIEDSAVTNLRDRAKGVLTTLRKEIQKAVSDSE